MNPQPAFLVVRVSLTTDGWNGNVSLHEDYHDQPLKEIDGGSVLVPEALFADRAAAERERDRRERGARELLNPFWFGNPNRSYTTSLNELEFRDRIRALRLTPPIMYSTNFGQQSDWWLWWDLASHDWTDAQRAAVWSLLDGVRLFEVVEVELE